MHRAIFDSFVEELEKIALSEKGVDEFKKQYEDARKAGKAPGTTLKQDFKATVRRFLKPKQLLRRVKWSLTAPGVPLHVKALTGLGLASTAASALPKEDPSGERKSRVRRALEGAGATLGGVAGRGFLGSVAGSMAGGAVGNLAGKAIDTVRGYKPQE